MGNSVMGGAVGYTSFICVDCKMVLLRKPGVWVHDDKPCLSCAAKPKYKEYTKEDLEWQRGIGQAEGENKERKRILSKLEELGIELPKMFAYMLEFEEGCDTQKEYMKEFKLDLAGVRVGNKLIAQNNWTVAGDMSWIVSNPSRKDITIVPGDIFEITNISKHYIADDKGYLFSISLTHNNVQEFVVNEGFLYLIDKKFEQLLGQNK